MPEPFHLTEPAQTLKRFLVAPPQKNAPATSSADHEAGTTTIADSAPPTQHDMIPPFKANPVPRSLRQKPLTVHEQLRKSRLDASLRNDLAAPVGFPGLSQSKREEFVAEARRKEAEELASSRKFRAAPVRVMELAAKFVSRRVEDQPVTRPVSVHFFTEARARTPRRRSSSVGDHGGGAEARTSGRAPSGVGGGGGGYAVSGPTCSWMWGNGTRRLP